MEDNTYRWPGNDPEPPKKPKKPDMKRLAKNVLVVILFIIIRSGYDFPSDRGTEQGRALRWGGSS